MSSDAALRLTEIVALPLGPRIDPLLDFVQQQLLSSQADDAVMGATRDAILGLINASAGNPRQRLHLGELLGRLGDPRIRMPRHDNYWVDIRFDDGASFQIGRFMVTNHEYQQWVEAGGYDDTAVWSEDGRAWLAATDETWREMADGDDVAEMLVSNQPVVGVTWFEASAYARAQGARLATQAERRWVTRGAEKRPYPWGEPFGVGNANTREERLGRPCAIGLYRSDCTPDGVWDLAGNAAEWTSTGTESQRVLHPGSWARPSMASWAKALDMVAPGTRSADLGFRIARG